MIVCINLEGDLELWQEHDPDKHHAWPAWTVIIDVMGKHDIIFGIYGTMDRPETFGREALGEL